LGECLARPLAHRRALGWRPHSGAAAGRTQKMEAPLNRSWGQYLLDALCVAMMVTAVTGMLYILSRV